jgi:hypothetical protein
MTPAPSNRLGIAGFVLSLLGLISCGLLAPVGLVLSLVGVRKEPRGLAIAGAVISLVSFVPPVLFGSAILGFFKSVSARRNALLATSSSAPAITPGRGLSASAYFSDDDGKTWFIDDAANVPPFAHNGKTAYRALLYRCPEGKPFVQRLESFTDEAKSKIEADIAAGKPPLTAEYRYLAHGMMIKRPGKTEWVELKEGDPESQIKWGEVMSATCPDGLPNARPVSIEENAQP